MVSYLQAFLASITGYLPLLLGAILVLIVGWLLAMLVAGVVRSLLGRTRLDDRIANMLSGAEGAPPRRIDTERWVSTAVFWLIMLFVIVIFLQVLNLTIVSEPLTRLLSGILGVIPGLLGALVLLFVAWLIATFLRILVVRVVSASSFFRRVSTDAQVRSQDRVSVAQTLGNLVYWLVFLLFLPGILDALNLQGILVPVQRVVDEILGVLPNLLAAAVILLVGWLVARIIRQVVTNLLAGIGLDRLGGQTMAGMLGEQRLSDIIGTIVYVLVLIPVAIAALNALNIPAVSVPATNMLNSLLNALPAIFGALVLLGLAYFVGKLVGAFVAGILTRLGFNRLFIPLGWKPGPAVGTSAAAAAAEGETPPSPTNPYGSEPPAPSAAHQAAETGGPGRVTPGQTTPAEVVGYLATAAIVLFAAMEAADLLGFNFLAVLVSDLIIAATRILVGLVIFGIGVYLASLAARAVRSAAGSQAYILAPAARAAILIFAGALALREMGIAESIVNLAFGLLLGAVAVAAALAFGLGGRDIAHRQLERWTNSLSSPPPGPGPSSLRSSPPPAGPDKD